MSAPPFDQSVAHRWFAVEFNNQAWDLVESVHRTPEETERMIHLAHAAAAHWDEVGAPINRMRALSLLTHASAVAGEGRQALKFARECAELSTKLNDEPTPFDRAAVAVGLSCALRSAGQSVEAQSCERQARVLVERLDDADDRTVLEKLLRLECPAEQKA